MVRLPSKTERATQFHEPLRKNNKRLMIDGWRLKEDEVERMKDDVLFVLNDVRLAGDTLFVAQ